MPALTHDEPKDYGLDAEVRQHSSKKTHCVSGDGLPENDRTVCVSLFSIDNVIHLSALSPDLGEFQQVSQTLGEVAVLPVNLWQTCGRRKRGGGEGGGGGWI